MAWIKVISGAEATGELREWYTQIGMKPGGRPGSPYQVLTLNPSALRTLNEFQKAVRFGPSDLTRLQREMIATVVSALNDCLF